MQKMPNELQYSLLRFLELLNYRGINRLQWNGEQQSGELAMLNLLNHHSSRAQEEVVSDSSSVLSQENDIENFLPGFELTNAFDRGSEPKNPDYFYNESDRESKERSMDEEDDSFYKYSSSGIASDRRYSNNSERIPESLIKEGKGRLTSQQAYREWEWHDLATTKEMLPENSELTANDTDEVTTDNGGLYEPFRPELSEIATENCSLVQLLPAAKYQDLLDLNYMGSIKVKGLDASRRYKNNLVVVIQNSDNEDLLVCACRSEILVYKFGDHRHIPKAKPVLRFDTRPDNTTDVHRLVLTWAYFPHTINFMTSVNNWVNGPAVGVCTDDGSILVWHVDTLREEIKRLSKTSQPDPRLYGLRIGSDVKLQMDSSAWGLDFASAFDSKGEQHFVLVASSNSQRATLFYYHQQTKAYLSVNTHQLLHNIPDVSVVEYHIEGTKHTVYISCASISGELVLFKCIFKTNCESTEPAESQWPLIQEDVQFDEPFVIRRTSLGSDCWTIRPVQAKFFKSVQSIRAMTGDPFIDEEQEVSHILTESSIINASPDPMVSADLGGAAYWQFFDSPVVHLASCRFSNNEIENSSKFVSCDEEYRRVHEAYKHMCEHTISIEPGLRDIMLAVSTDLRLGLFRADTLFCNCATKKVFTLKVPMNNETKWCNRILITHVVKELLCFIAVSQIGIVTIMRLCEYRGLYGMRQEHLFPNALSLTIAESSLRTIIGLTTRNVSITAECPRFLLYIVYSDGLILTYELRDKGSAIVVDFDF